MQIEQEMRTTVDTWAMFEKVTWERVLLVLLVLLLARLLSAVVVRGLRNAAEAARPRLRLAILRWLPIARLLIGFAAAIVAIPILVEPTFRNIVAIAAPFAVALAFAFKDYGSSIVAGIATILENAYQPGLGRNRWGIWGSDCEACDFSSPMPDRWRVTPTSGLNPSDARYADEDRSCSPGAKNKEKPESSTEGERARVA